MTKARDIADFKFENIVDTGTEGTKVALGTTAQRGSTTGQWRFNSTTGFFEGRNSTGFQSLEPASTIGSVDVTEVDSQAGGNQTFVITGTNFTSGGTISFLGNAGTDFNASSTTIDSGTQITAVAPKSSFNNTNEPYKIKFTSANGVTGQSATGLISVDTSPTWSTASGQVGGLIYKNVAMTNTTLLATDPDSDAIAYSILSGALPTGLSLSSGGVISGTPTPTISSDTTYNFTTRATANSKTTDRAFNIVVKNVNTGIHNSAPLTGGTAWFDSGSSAGGYYGFDDASDYRLQANDLITTFKTRKSGTGQQGWWGMVAEKSTTTNGYVIIGAWFWEYNNPSDGAIVTHETSLATTFVKHNSITALSGNKIIIPSGATASTGTGEYYTAWCSQDGSYGNGSLYDYDGSGSGGNIDYIQVSGLATNLGISEAYPDNLSSDQVIVTSNHNTGQDIQIQISGS